MARPKVREDRKQEREFDLGAFWGGVVEFWNLEIKRPAFTRTVDRRKLGLANKDNGKLREISDENMRFRTIPRERTDKFNTLYSKAKTALSGFSVPGFPFLPGTISPVRKDRENPMLDSLAPIHDEFEKEVEKLIQDLPLLKEQQKERYVKAADALWDNNKNIREKFEDKKEDFVSAFVGELETSFPTASMIRQGYYFIIHNLGTIKKTIGLMTSEEFLKDSETSRKHKLIVEAHDAARKEVLDWVAAQAARVRVGMLQALAPVIHGMREGKVLTKAVADRINKHIEEVSNWDLFGDKSFDEITAFCKDAITIAREQASSYEAEQAKFLLECAMAKVEDSLTEMKFDPADFRLIELDEGFSGALAADKENMSYIQKRLSAEIAKATKLVAGVLGGTAKEKEAAEERLREALRVKAIADDGGDDAAVEVAERFARLDLSDPEQNAQNEDDADTRLIELDDVNEDSEPPIHVIEQNSAEIEFQPMALELD